MKNRSRSNSKDNNIIRKHKRKNAIIEQDISSSSEESDVSMPNIRKQFTLQEKKEYIKKYEDIKNKIQKSVKMQHPPELIISYSSLREWIKQKWFI